MTAKTATSNALHAYLLDPLERAASTFVQQFVVVLLATGSAGLMAYQEWGKAACTAAFAALISLLTSILTFKVPALDAESDLAWRVIKSFLQSFIGTLIASAVTNVVDVDWKAALAVAIPVALTALLKGLAALAAPWTNGASLLPVADPYENDTATRRHNTVAAEDRNTSSVLDE